MREKNHADLTIVKNCYYCSGDHFAPLYDQVYDRLAVSRESWSFVRCQTCGAALLSPCPEAEALTRFYPPHYIFSLDKTNASLRYYIAKLEYLMHFRWVHACQARKTMKLIGRPNGKSLRLLDVGCGNGLLLREFQKLGFDVEGIDLRREAVDHVRTTWGISAQVMSADQVVTHYPKESFDVITAFHILEHITDPRDYIVQWHTLLKPGGALILGLPFIDSLQVKLFGANHINITEAPRHVSIPSQQAVRILCERSKFEKVIIIPEGSLLIASLAGLSLFPKGATTYQYAQTKKWATGVSRILMIITTYMILPVIWAKQHLLRRHRSSAGIVSAFKPT